MMALQHNVSLELYSRSIAYYQCLAREAGERAKITSIAFHPHLSGSPHRFVDAEKTYVDLLEKPGVLCWNGEQILEWYLAAREGH